MTTVKTNIIRVRYRRKEDQKRQLKVLVKVGYMANDKFRELKRYEITIRDKLNNIYRVTDQQYERLRAQPPSEQRLELFEIETKIKKIVLELLETGKDFNVKEINNRLYSIQSKEAEDTKVKSWNEFLKEINYGEYDREFTREEIDRIEEAINDAENKTQKTLSDEDIDGIKNAVLLDIQLKKEKEYVKTLSLDERYSKRKFNHDNIIETFGFCWSKNPKNDDPLVPESYKALIFHLADYLINGENVNYSLKSFNSNWVEKFLKFKYKNGYPEIHLTGYTPFTIMEHREKFIKAKRGVFTIARFRKLVQFLIRYINILQKNKLLSEKAINSSLIEASDYISRKVNTDNFTKIEYTLDYEEIEQLLSTSFNDKKMQLAADMYVIQMFAGGLRPNELYKGNIRFEPDYVSFFRSKNKKITKNPILPELRNVLNKYPNGLPSFLTIKEYRDELKKIAKHFEWNRIIEEPNTKLNSKEPTIKHKLHEVFTPLTARKSFINYLANMGLPEELIIQFTGHANVQILKHYKQKLNLEQKKKIIQKLIAEFNK